MSLFELRHPVEESATSVLLVVDRPMLCAGMRLALDAAAGFEVVGEVETLVEGGRFVQSWHPKVVVLDLHLKGRRTLDDLPGLAIAWPGTRVVALVDSGSQKALPALLAGAHGVVPNSAPGESLRSAIRSVLHGDIWTEAGTAMGLVGILLERRREPQSEERLTPREHEVLALVADGKRNKEIARALGIKMRTVKSHVSSLLGKVGVEDRLQLALYSRDRSIGRGGGRG